jgi:hypothetical protein
VEVRNLLTYAFLGSPWFTEVNQVNCKTTVEILQ